ncbi:MAG: hypothetical protein MRERC_2c103 [Mycoplasmataceae bacterium RC_NB112A]|nr:MAG: hypothetical protein MRERC_2c103 [Mycoplasmataceae bacterium RC_NB112A]
MAKWRDFWWKDFEVFIKIFFVLVFFINNPLFYFFLHLYGHKK